jgi:hypothetical protein
MQLAAVMSVHWPTGSCPAGTGEHVPSLPGSAHDWQVPVQAVMQQIPCSQNPDRQSAAAAQVPPGGFFPQLVLTQKFPVVQSVLAAHEFLHVPPVPHRNGSHGCVVPATHLPAPSHSEASVSVDPAHEPAAHEVPLA